VVYCTVALENNNLIAVLAKRRALLQSARFKLRDATAVDSDDDNETMQRLPESFQDEHPLLHASLQKAQFECQKLLALIMEKNDGDDNQVYPVSSVFITFETEAEQRHALSQLTTSRMNIVTNDTAAILATHAFRGNLVLDVEEAKEPSAIRWEDLDTPLLIRVLQRICTGAVTIVLIWVGFIAVKRSFAFNVNFAAFLIAILNIAVPNIFKVVNKLESHSKEGTYQASLYAKISIFRFVNTAIVPTVIKPFTATISKDKAALIPAIYAVLKAEIVTAPILHMCDIVGNAKRFLLAPHAANQAAMNSYFRGSIQNLGEKYTVSRQLKELITAK